MAKIIVWLIVVFVVLLALRMVNMRNARRRQGAQTKQATAPASKSGEPMVRCVRCGTYLPQAEARSVRGGYACIAGECAGHA